MTQLTPLKGIPGLLDQTISVVNEKIAGMQVRRQLNLPIDLLSCSSN